MTILASVIAITLVAMAVGAGTLAYFSDTESTGDYTFTAGELSILVTDSQFATPDDWAPGDTADFTIKIKNTGKIAIKQMLMGDMDVSGDLGLLDMIVITQCEEQVYKTGTGWTGMITSFNPDLWINGADGLTLAEYFVSYPDSTPGHHDGWDSLMSNYGAVGDLMPGETLEIKYYLKFDEDAGDEYQLNSCSFKLNVYATHHDDPTALPGYVN